MEPVNQPWWRDDRAAAVLLAALAVLTHLPDLTCGFLADDFQQLVGVSSGGRADLGKALGYFVQPLPGVDAPLPQDYDARFWRPLLYLSLGLDFALFGLRAAAFQAINVALHAGVVLALFALLRTRDRAVAFAAAALFATWPGAHEAVPWISARSGPLALGFVLLSLGSLERGHPLRAGALALAALLSKETAFVVAPLALVFALCRPTDRGRAVRSTGPVWAAFGVYLALRYRMLGEFGGGYAVHDTPLWSASLWPGRLETARTLLAPLKAADLGTGPQTALSVVVLGLLVAGLAVALRQPERRWLAAAGLLWLAGSFVPIHNLTVFRALHADARFLYEPAAPLCLLLAVAGASLLRSRRLAVGALALALIGSAVLYRVNVEDRREATAITRVLRAAAVDAVRLNPTHHHAFVDVPRRHRGVQLGNNAFPWALVPPFSGDPKPAGVEVHYRDARERRRVDALVGAARRGEAQAVWVWTGRELRRW